MKSSKALKKSAYKVPQKRVVSNKVLVTFSLYLLGIYLLLLSLIERSPLLLIITTIAAITAIIYSSIKNNNSTNIRSKLLVLPIHQFVTDISTIAVSVICAIKFVRLRLLINLIKNNKAVSLILFIYILFMLTLITWGIPNPSHPYNYFMDEWHQSQSVRMVFAKGTPNVPGAANGSMFQFFLSGLYLIPFVIFGIVNPFLIHSSLDSLEMQQRLFEILRLNTLFFGVASIILLTYIAKKYFKLHPFITIFLFVFNPLWLTLSNYFKYDIALMFWILLSFFFLLKYIETSKLANYYIGSFFSGLALAVKVSVLPLFLLTVSSFFIANYGKINKKVREFIFGLLILGGTFLLFGIPDILFGKGDMREYLYDNLVRTPNLEASYNLGMNYIAFMFVKIIPTAFGYVLFGISLIGIIYVGFLSKKNKYVRLLLFAFLFFALSLLTLKIEARQNRLLVLLPFLALMSGILLQQVTQLRYGKKLVIGIFVVLFFLQAAESLSWVAIKYHQDPRQISSNWIVNNIPSGSSIGIENIPIYQSLPDVILKEFYTEKPNDKKQNRFIYSVIDNKTQLPEYVIISNEKVGSEYLINSPKGKLALRLKNQGYKKIYEERLNTSALSFFRSDMDYYMSGLVQAPISISVYKSIKR
jgi:hypothetical protein